MGASEPAVQPQFLAEAVMPSLLGGLGGLLLFASNGMAMVGRHV